LNRPDKGKTKVIGDKKIEKERNRKFELSRNDRFKYRTRYLILEILPETQKKQVLVSTEPLPASFSWYARQDSNPPQADFGCASTCGLRIRRPGF